MAHERDDKYDDSEYHFSDDQISYEPESVEAKPSALNRAAITAKLIQYKRPLIGMGVFFVLIFAVYKIIAPSSTNPTTEFAQTGPSTAAVTTATTVKTTIEPAKTLKVTAQPTPDTQLPSDTIQQQPAAAPVASMADQQAGLPAPPVAQSTTQQQVEMPTEQNIPAPPTNMPAAAQPTNMPPPAMPGPQPEMPSGNMSATDRLTVLETQNAKLQADFTQKLAEEQAQNAALQGKLQDLTMRMTSLEATLIRLGRMLHEMKGGKSLDEPASSGAPTRMISAPAAAGPRVTYSVQAIIPGRAWLKSESGETVTVTEGDAVKGLGRIVKIDPYDGIVQIDANGRAISLSYGTSPE